MTILYILFFVIVAVGGYFLVGEAIELIKDWADEEFEKEQRDKEKVELLKQIAGKVQE